MRTDELIGLLAADTRPVRPAAVARRFGVGLGVAAPLVAFVLLVVMGLPLRADLAASLARATDWPKYALVLALLAAGWHACARLSRPDGASRAAALAAAAPVVAVAALALATLARAPAELRAAMVFGSTWTVCPLIIATLSVPAFAVVARVMRGLAPTRLGAAGAAVGLFAGAIAATVYALHCPEREPAFLAVWYVLGIAAPVVAGALLGPRVLRW